MTDAWHFRRAAPIRKKAKTLIMGIVNLTPDSFSDGGAPPPSPREAAATALSLLAEGADVIDFGAESSRPGAKTLRFDEEIARLGDAVKLTRAKTDAPLSVDTYHPESAAYVLDQGADILNDITALRGGWDAGAETATAMATVAARENAHVLLMHMPSSPASMQEAPHYQNVLEDVQAFLLGRAAFAVEQGVARENIWLDPGFGFGKNFSHNRTLLAELERFVETEYPLIVGMSRKRMIQDALALAVDQRLEASLALAVIAAMKGASMIRVHDVKATARAVGMADAVRT